MPPTGNPNVRRRTLVYKALKTVTAVGSIATLINPFEPAAAVRSFYAGHGQPGAPGDEDLENGHRSLSSGVYRLRYEWYDDRYRTLDVRIDRSTYASAARKSRGYVSAFDAARSNPTAGRIASALSGFVRPDPGGSHSAEQRRLATAVAFVRSFEYAVDPDTKGSVEYHRDPVETLVDGRGDCKDLTYLLAAILSQPPFEYRTAMVFIPEHMLLGVHRADLPPSVADDTLADTDYVPIESTVDDPIGTLTGEPLLGIYNSGFEYIDGRAALETGWRFLRDPSESEALTNSL